MLEPRQRDRYARELRAMIAEAARQDPEGFAEIRALVHSCEESLWTESGTRLLLEGYSVRDIARATGVSKSAVWRHASGAKP